MSLVGREIKPLTQRMGPFICLTSISDETHDILLSVANKIRKNKKLKKDNDYRKRLAGNIKEEYSYANAFTQKQKNIVYEELLWLASNYTKMASSYNGKKYGCEPDQIFLQEPIWVNFMKSGEWNPAHAHSGDISCVAYLKVPKEIEEENKTTEESSKSNTPSAGRIEFTYGEDIGYTVSGAMYTPREKDMIIFPAKLNHMVYPFQSKQERISISVNFSDIRRAKLNLGMRI